LALVTNPIRPRPLVWVSGRPPGHIREATSWVVSRVWKAAEAVASPTMSARPWASAGCSVENGAEVVLDGRLRAQPFRCGCDFVAAGLAQHQRREDCGIGPGGPPAPAARAPRPVRARPRARGP
jgi:hypothetical protein